MLQQQQQQEHLQLRGPKGSGCELATTTATNKNKSCDFSSSRMRQEEEEEEDEQMNSLSAPSSPTGEIIINLNSSSGSVIDGTDPGESKSSPGNLSSSSTTSGISSGASSSETESGNVKSSEAQETTAVDALLLRKSAQEIVSRLPKVSILKPLMGIDQNLAANLETYFTMDYPRQCYEILFCVENKEDPVVGLCQSLIEKYRGEVDARLFIGGEHVGVNPKINNMEPGYRESKYELIMISDSGIKSE